MLVVDESAYFCSLLNTIRRYIDFTRYKMCHTVVRIPFAERGSTTAFIGDKVGLKRRSEPGCLIVKSM